MIGAGAQILYHAPYTVSTDKGQGSWQTPPTAICGKIIKSQRNSITNINVEEQHFSHVVWIHEDYTINLKDKVGFVNDTDELCEVVHDFGNKKWGLV